MPDDSAFCVSGQRRYPDDSPLLGGAHVYLADPFPEMATEGEEVVVGGDGTNLGLHRFVEDVDAAVERAVAAGAIMKMPPMDMFWAIGTHRFWIPTVTSGRSPPT